MHEIKKVLDLPHSRYARVGAVMVSGIWRPGSCGSILMDPGSRGSIYLSGKLPLIIIVMIRWDAGRGVNN